MRKPAKKPVAGQLAVVVKNVAPIKEQPDTNSELATQAIIGQPVVVEGGQKDWLFVQGWDTCRGWIAEAGVRILEDQSRAYASTGPVAVIRELIVDVKQEPSEVAPILTKVTVSAELEVAGSLDGWVEIRLPDGRPGYIRKHESKLLDKDLAQTMWLPQPEKLVETAERFIGTPYLWGGTTPFGLDCSGFVQLIYRVHGVTLLRNASWQASDPRGQSVEKKDIHAGDLIFFAKNGRTDVKSVSHVGMAVSRDKFIHSCGHSGVIITALDDPRYSNIYWGARRLRLATLDPGGGAPED